MDSRTRAKTSARSGSTSRAAPPRDLDTGNWQTQARIIPPAPALGPAAAAPLHCSAVLTHHWLVRRRGGEAVLSALCELLPDAPIHTLVHDPAGVGDGWPQVHTSFLQNIPGARRHYPKLLPLMPLAARRMRLPKVDLVVCSDAALAKAMTPHADSKVVCYCHSPMRYAWEPAIAADYARALPPGLRLAFRVTAARVRKADRRAAPRVDQFVANSKHVAERIRRCYERDSVVVHPPVDLPPEPATTPRESFYLCLGQHVPYKRLDLAVDACRKLGRRLVVIGDGPGLRHIDPQRDLHVQTLGWQSRDVIEDHLRRAAALIFPGEEDFGIVPVEAMAQGCPVIAYAVGGATETVIPDRTGVWFEEQTVDSLADALRRVERMTFDARAMHAHTQQFSRERFLREMRDVLNSVLHAPAR